MKEGDQFSSASAGISMNLCAALARYQGLDSLLPEFLPVRVKDLPNFSKMDPEMVYRLFTNNKNATKVSSDFLVNAFNGLQPIALDKLRQNYHPVQIFTISPLNKFSQGSLNSLLTQYHICMAWLDNQAPRLVIYASFGSLASIDKTEMVEIAWGLAYSDQPFLWVVHPSSINGHEWVELSQGFEEKARERSLIINWDPLQEQPISSPKQWKNRPCCKSKKRVPHLVIFPLPFQGHINPMLQLATLLHSKGFSITVIHTHFNSPSPFNFPNFNFEPIPDVLSDGQLWSEDPLTLVSILNDTCQVPFHDRLCQLLTDGPHGPVKCIITDELFYFTKAVADQLNLPRILLGTTSATFSSTMASVKLLQQNGVISITDMYGLPNMHIPEIQPLRIKDIPDFSMTDPDTCERFWADMINAIRSALGCIMNTFDNLEPTAFEKVRQDRHPTPLFAVGPLYKFSPGSSNSLLTQDYSCMAWLDKQAPQSVIYISFGSLASITKTDLVEIAWGLANSDQPFLWVVRPGSIHGHDCNELPEGFEEKTRERGQIVKWAPQQEVLAHPSVGGFWTHNGWNSTLESICEGVPMLCSPYLWDQNVHARYVSHVWRVGMQLEKWFDRSEIEWAVRRLMVEIEGKEMRERVGGLKENAMRCMAKGGSSYESLESLIDLIMSL
ncbi:UDP-glycosyltransferase 76B1-like [Magnolia sinica]|uniref:UDP-glycosyltransferase 76B1-like n=1 Tax=Magnolia sinica TaxID=86752 RepID=UPI00265A9DAE|nr:UDP-glycosyltransferase 76B1-like [Magnolia sinica]